MTSFMRNMLGLSNCGGMTKQAKIRIMCSVTLLMSVGFIMMGLKGIVVGDIVLLIVWIFHMAYFTFGVKTV